MVYAFYFSVTVIFYATFVQINGQNYCAPAPVQNIVLYDDHILSWNQLPSESCAVDHYLVYIQSETDWNEHLYLTDQNIVDVGHLPECTNVRFTVVPISTEYVEGNKTTMYTKTPAPPDVDLDLIYFRLSTNTNGLMLEWDVDDSWKRCLKEFRMVSYNEDNDEILTMYMLFPYAYINNLIPCASYVFTVTALYNLQTEGRVSVIRYTVPTAKIAAPSLQRITIGSTTADLTWILSSPSENRCPVNALIIDGSPYFNISYPIASQNQVNRPQLNVRLTGLQPNTMYVLRVSANNTSGLSEPFIIGIQTLEN